MHAGRSTPPEIWPSWRPAIIRRRKNDGIHPPVEAVGAGPGGTQSSVPFGLWTATMIQSLALSLGIFVLTLCVQAVPTAILIRIATSKHPRSLTRPLLWPNFILFQMAAVFLALAHLVDIALWAFLYCLCGEFAEFEVAYYHSAVNFSSL